MIQILTLDIEIAGERSTKLIALEDGVFVGCVELQHRPHKSRDIPEFALEMKRRSASFKQLYVDPKWRRRGIGRALIARCATVAHISECESLGAVIEDNHALAVPQLEFAALRFRELANQKELPEHWRNACGLWAILVNGTIEKILASAAKDRVASSLETADKRALPITCGNL